MYPNLGASTQTPFLSAEFAGFSTQVNINSTPVKSEGVSAAASHGESLRTRVALNVQHYKGVNEAKIIAEHDIPETTLLLFTRVFITEATGVRTMM